MIEKKCSSQDKISTKKDNKCLLVLHWSVKHLKLYARTTDKCMFYNLISLKVGDVVFNNSVI